jgi:hypothetical protein
MRVIDHETCPQRSDYPEKSLFVFDFDGVLIDQIEDVLARKPEGEGERVALERIAKRHSIHPELFETPYLRHLVYQSIALNEPAPPHILLRFIQRLDDTGDPYMILTARSGLYAIQRLTAYIETHRLYPQEMFCVGRAAKTTQLEFLLDRFPQHTICYFEDSQKHVDAAEALGNDRLIVTHVKWPEALGSADAIIAKMLAPT